MATQLQKRDRANAVVQREQRKSRRFLVQLPLIVRWTNGTLIEQAETETKDVSSGGVRFHLPKALKSGSPVEVLMTLPRQMLLVGSVRVRCRGRVVRTSQGSDNVEVIAEIERFEFIRDAESAA
jgi:PilZ domain